MGGRECVELLFDVRECALFWVLNGISSSGGIVGGGGGGGGGPGAGDDPRGLGRDFSESSLVVEVPVVLLARALCLDPDILEVLFRELDSDLTPFLEEEEVL